MTGRATHRRLRRGPARHAPGGAEFSRPVLAHAPLFLVGTLLLLATPGLASPTAATFGHPAPLGTPAPGAHVATRAPVNENISVPLPNPSAPGPNGTRTALNGSAGDILLVTVIVSLGSFNSTWGVVQVHLPGLSVRFPIYGGADPQFPLSVSARNLTFANNGTLSYPTALPLTRIAEFHPGLNATLTSNGYAPLASLPWGTVALNVSWSYTLNNSSGQLRVGAGPSLPQSIFPAQSFILSYAGPVTLLVGTQFTACLTGTVANRSFGLRGVNASGIVFSNVSTFLGPGSTGCLEMPVPLTTSVGKVTVQLWEYTSEPIRLKPIPATTVAGAIGRIAGAVAPSNVSVLLTIDGFPIAPTVGGNYSIGMVPGAHRVFFNASGYWPQATLINLTAGTTVWINLTLLPKNQEPTKFGAPPLLTLTPGQTAILALAALLVVLAGAYLIWQRRRPPAPTSTPTPPAGAGTERGARGPAHP
jgi:hypothetical protein